MLRTAASSAMRASRTMTSSGVRAMSAATSIQERLAELVPEKQAVVKELRTVHADKKVGEVNVGQVIGGARGVKCMLWDASALDAMEGIRFRGMTIPEVQKALPLSPSGGEEPMSEGLIWLLLTGEVPTQAQAVSLRDELASRAALPEDVKAHVNSLHPGLHPMTKFSSSILALQQHSQFAAAYAGGAPKSEYWKHTLEDVLTCIARVPEVAAMIYRNDFCEDKAVPAARADLDWAANYAWQMKGEENEVLFDLFRLYMNIHSDHEGGNASAHTAHLVASTLSDPYLALSAAMNALAGPLHGLANQEVLRWVLDLQATFQERGKEVTHDTIREFAWETLNAGKVIPGYGHAVLRKTDPRFTAQREFALKFMPDDPLVKIVSTVYEVVPDVLTEHGKTANPWPNVDSHSGALLWHLGLREFNYYTVMFGVSRATGALTQVFWDRALGLPLERPKSVTTDWLVDFVKKSD